jgi:broad specificity phosphatase PhoE
VKGFFSRNDPSTEEKHIQLFLIRHGEASHNVEEKLAKQRALELASKRGFAEESKEAKQLIREARSAVLENPEFFDAPLSDLGVEQARLAAEQLQQWFNESDELQPPLEIFVSPLQRTLKTAATIFPGHDRVHVREELRERVTGRPADNRSASLALMARKSFSRFSFRRLRLGSWLEKRDLADSFAEEEAEMIQDETRFYRRTSSIADTVEDEERLCRRAKKLFSLLARSQYNSVAVVTHKGYLRSLEKSVFGQTDAEEFDNCEIRVYRLNLDGQTLIPDSIERLK